MKPIELTPDEVELIRSWLLQRRSAYQDLTDTFVAANQAYHKKLVQSLDRALDSVVVGQSFIKPNARLLIKGCMNQFAMDEVRAVLRQLSELTWPAWYAYVREHSSVVEHAELILNLWNKLVKKGDRFRLPSKRLATLDEIFAAHEVFASFSDLKPYKVAFVIADGMVYRLSLDSEKAEVEGPFQYSREALEDIFMKCLSPATFCRAIRAYGAEHQLHAWHTLLLNEMKGMPVEA